MGPFKHVLRTTVLVCWALSIAPPANSQKIDKASAQPALWRDPGAIQIRDLRFGPGAAHLAPVGPFTFVEEDKSGESPKFEVTDARGTKWVVKLGPEAQAETFSTRLIWSVGYFAEEAYYFPRARIRGLKKLSRGMDYVGQRGLVRGARFEPRRSHIERGPTWDWNDNPFNGTHELSGLKILMILLNNYDARKENNRVLYAIEPGGGPAARYAVTDLGATLGRAGGLGGKRSKNNLHDFLSTRFVLGVHDDGAVQFDYDTRPTKLGHFAIFYPPYYRGQVKKEKAMRGIPVEHARWIGSLLSQLSDQQLRDAFAAGGYKRSAMQAYVTTLRARINQLARL
jgi:hypothetical protein